MTSRRQRRKFQETLNIKTSRLNSPTENKEENGKRKEANNRPRKRASQTERKPETEDGE